MKIKIQKYNDFAQGLPIRVNITCIEADKLPTTHIFRLDERYSTYLKVSFINDEVTFGRNEIEEGFYSIEEAENFIDQIIVDIREEVRIHFLTKWEHEEEYEIEI